MPSFVGSPDPGRKGRLGAAGKKMCHRMRQPSEWFGQHSLLAKGEPAAYMQSKTGQCRCCQALQLTMRYLSGMAATCTDLPASYSLYANRIGLCFSAAEEDGAHLQDNEDGDASPPVPAHLRTCQTPRYATASPIVMSTPKSF